ncbi:MAG: histidinol dehydrogenase [Verrucomicrobia bacterium]|nr:histidinol dehydrogenase [Verrucomicrobiota bacterium]
MRILRHTDENFARELGLLNRRAEPNLTVRSKVAEILAAVRARGDTALLEYNARFGGPDFSAAAKLRVTAEELNAAAGALDVRHQRALAEAHENVRDFALRSLRRDWHTKNRQGAEVGERFTPFPRVGIYVPGGSAPLVSTAIMTCTLAAAAGVPEIVVTTPADARGRIAPALLCALELAGATEIYKVGGAQAIAALACGTNTIAPVSKIFGPGNAYVVEAKRQVVGPVAIDLLPGPSEVLVLADDTAKPAWIAADLLAQAEHGADSIAALVTDSEALLVAVEQAVAEQLKTLERQAQLGPALAGESSFLALVRDLDAAIALANAFAPEHLAIHTAHPDAVAAKVHTAGAIFLGGWSPVAAGDFLAGPSHTLPTGGAGKSFAGLTVDQFQRRTSWMRFDEASLRHSLPIIQAFSDLEGLDAHGRSAAIRFDAPA